MSSEKRKAKPEEIAITLVALDREFVSGRSRNGAAEARNPWCLDSGSKDHRIHPGNRSVLHDFQRMSTGLTISIEVRNGNVLKAVATAMLYQPMRQT